MKKIVIISSSASTFIGFRWNLINDLIKQGCAVYLLAPHNTAENSDVLKSIGANVVDIQMSRVGINPLSDIFTILSIYRNILKIKPDVVFTSLIKAVIYGTLAAWMAGVPKRFAMIEGLGYVYTYQFSELSVPKIILKIIVNFLYKISLSCANKVIFLNPDDNKEFVSLGLVPVEKTICISGIGIDLKKWSFTPLQEGAPRFLMVARLLREKGVNEYAQAAKYVKLKYPQTEFLLLGGLDPNPGAIQLEQVSAWHEQGVLTWCGHVSVAEHMKAASVFVLPSYREGVPVSTMEAMAIGRPVITTDAPGCRETVVDGVNGFMVQAKDAVGLAEKMIWFIENASSIVTMGAASRKMAEVKFDVHKINARLIEIMFSDEDEKTD